MNRAKRGNKKPPIFSVIAERGGVAGAEMERVFNQGIGLVLVVPRSRADAVLRAIADCGEEAWAIGEVVAGSGDARLVGSHPRG